MKSESSVSEELKELKLRWELNRLADEVLEGCLQEKLSVKRTLERFLDEVGRRMGAHGGAILTRDEELTEAAFAWGDLGDEDPWTLLAGREAGVHALDGMTLACQPLDVAGVTVGQAGFVFPSSAGEAPAAELLAGRLHAVCEELDGILSTIHQAAEKQELILAINAALSNRVFERGLDDAVEVLHRGVPFKECVVLWRDVVSADGLFYRVYVNGKLAFHGDGRRHPGMEAAIAAHGLDLLSPERNRLQSALGFGAGTESVLMSGEAQADWLGKVLFRGDGGGFSPASMDLVRVLAQMARDRLVDHNRERRHLAQFFSAPVITELLREPNYHEKYLAPREERIAILYADINGFTRITEQILEKPALIGEFVDAWTDGAVEILWKHGGTFDKMVGDCVIGLFGPPFYRESPTVQAVRALEAAREILDFTIAFTDAPQASRIKERPDVIEGLGVAVGVNLCMAHVGVYGPHRDITAFSAGMNATARLQALAGYREILAMESVLEAVSTIDGHAFRFGPIQESMVKNVRLPLRYARVEP